MASARAAPRTSSRSRQTFPVSERATPRNAGGGSMGKAEAGSVMMLSAGGACGMGPNHPSHSILPMTAMAEAGIRISLIFRWIKQAKVPFPERRGRKSGSAGSTSPKKSGGMPKQDAVPDTRQFIKLTAVRPNPRKKDQASNVYFLIFVPPQEAVCGLTQRKSVHVHRAPARASDRKRTGGFSGAQRMNPTSPH